MTTETVEKPAEKSNPLATTKVNVPNLAVLISVAAVATGLTQPTSIGRLPFTHILKDQLGFGPAAIAAFMGMISFPWFFKPVAGLLSDAVPFLGTKRRHYVLFGSALAALGWLVLPLIPHRYWLLVFAGIAINVLLMLASTAVGGLLVESGRSTGAMGRLTAARIGAQGLVETAQDPLGGLLVSYGVGVMSVTGAVVTASLFPVAYFLLKEKRVSIRREHVLRNAGGEIKALLSTKSALLAIAAMALFFFAPGFVTVQSFRQLNTFGLSYKSIGLLGGIGGIFGIVAAGLYAFLCRLWPLWNLIFVALLLNGASNFLYLLYSKNFGTDAFIDGQSGFFWTLCVLVLYDLAARAVPAGSEAMAYGLFVSLSALFWRGSDYVGSLLAERGLEFWKLVTLNSATTLCVLALLPFLPAALKTARDR